MNNLIQQISQGAILSINKPLGWTSFDVVRKLKFLLQKAVPKIKIGHAGTLDPLAEGLLIVCTQKMTKQVETIQSQHKTYVAKIFLGATRLSYDKETEIDQTFGTNHINEDLVRKTLKTFEGEQEQIPPIFSAIKQDGKPVYLKARKGVEIEMKSKTIQIYEIALVRYEFPIIEIKVVVSKGTYIRSLAFDIGERLNSGAYLDHLVRTQIGDYKLENAHQITDLEHLIRNFSKSHADI
ncbi:MAG: tRNA pseudouridine(55) synthase TruB [Chitinophagales bacterium]